MYNVDWHWNNGMMEFWNTANEKYRLKFLLSIIPAFHYSIIPLFLYKFSNYIDYGFKTIFPIVLPLSIN